MLPYKVPAKLLSTCVSLLSACMIYCITAKHMQLYPLKDLLPYNSSKAAMNMRKAFCLLPVHSSSCSLQMPLDDVASSLPLKTYLTLSSRHFENATIVLPIVIRLDCCLIADLSYI